MRWAPALLPLAGPAQAQDWSEVQALFDERCVVCHSGEFAPLELRLDSYESVLEGSENGEMVVAGDPSRSKLLGHLLGVIEPRMPFDGPPRLSDDQMDLIARWIDGGALDEVGQPAGVPVGGRIRVEGMLTGEAEIDGSAFVVTAGTRADEGMLIGGKYELRAAVGAEGSIVAERRRAR